MSSSQALAGGDLMILGNIALHRGNIARTALGPRLPFVVYGSPRISNIRSSVRNPAGRPFARGAFACAVAADAGGRKGGRATGCEPIVLAQGDAKRPRPATWTSA